MVLLRNANVTLVFLVTFLLVCVSCARFPAKLAPDGADKSIVAIRVTEGGIFGSDRFAPVTLFIRLQADGQNRQGDLLISNHRAGGYAYLVNVSPGRYAAIGWGVGVHRDASWPVPQYGKELPHPYTELTHWYFPESLVNETIITVEPSGVAFMGEFDVSGDLPFDDADDTQKHYSNFFWGPPKPKEGFLHWLGESPSNFFAEYRKIQSEIATERFIRSSQGLAELGWDALDNDE